MQPTCEDAHAWRQTLGVMPLSRSTRVLAFVAGTSIAASAIALLLHAPSFGRVAVIPAVVLYGWTSFGNLVTLDDDLPGGWSDPKRVRSVWLVSLRDRVVKLAVFGGALALFLHTQTSQVSPNKQLHVTAKSLRGLVPSRCSAASEP
jgi:hypothetical protein